eukprot:231036_1
MNKINNNNMNDKETRNSNENEKNIYYNLVISDTTDHSIFMETKRDEHESEPPPTDKINELTLSNDNNNNNNSVSGQKRSYNTMQMEIENAINGTNITSSIDA